MTKLFLASVISESDHFISHLHLQRDINLLFNISRSWGLSFSYSKCARMNFCWSFQDTPALLQHYIGEQPVLYVDNHKDLGVRIDSFLKFHLHVREIAGKASGISYSNRRTCVEGLGLWGEGYRAWGEGRDTCITMTT